MGTRSLGLSVLIVVAVLVGWTGTALAQEVVPLHSDPVWQAYYWNNTDLAGPPVLQRGEANIDYDWGLGSPDPSIASDGFSARWSRYIDTAGGTYRFTAISDDGIRITIDGKKIIDQWYDHAVQTYHQDVALGAGHHLVVVEYYENGGSAVAKVSWAPTQAPVQGWRGEYFNNIMLSGTPALVRDDAQINFNWGYNSPAPGAVNADNFSVRWTRTLNFTPGNYQFRVTADDGVRLWVNNHLLIDVWQQQSARTYTGQIYLPGGAVELRMEYFEQGEVAVAQLSWSGGGTQPPPPPPPGNEIVVDDLDPGFVQGGSATAWRGAGEGYGGHLTWTRNNDRARANYNWARWYPRLAPGRYEVLVYIPDRYSTTGSARYWVSHADGYTRRIVDQSANGDRWVSLGVFRFRGSDMDYVSLADVTYEPYVSRLIAFDAVKWVPR